MERVKDGGKVSLERVFTASSESKNRKVHVRIVGEDTTACGKDVKEALGLSAGDAPHQVTCLACKEWIDEKTTP